jgi:hypothetical protein
MDSKADAEQVNAVTATVKEALSAMASTLPTGIEVITIVRKNFVEDCSGVFHGTVLATKDYVLTAPAAWRSDWCPLTYDESLSTTTVGSVYHASQDNARIIDAAYEKSEMKAARDQRSKETEAELLALKQSCVA